jgi:hypothetical protein
MGKHWLTDLSIECRSCRGIYGEWRYVKRVNCTEGVRRCVACMKDIPTNLRRIKGEQTNGGKCTLVSDIGNLIKVAFDG